jgi:hypothetical protein
MPELQLGGINAMKRPLIFVLGLSLCALRAGATPPKIMVFDFYLDNTSIEPTSDAEKARTARISDALRDLLRRSGNYDVIDEKPAEQQLSNVLWIGHCNGCEQPEARKAGAQLVAYGWVQKVSDLILNLNIVIEDANTGTPVKRGSVDIRGNTDETWDRGVRYLLEEHVFQTH